jgi:SulP family sulfate permease
VVVPVTPPGTERRSLRGRVTRGELLGGLTAAMVLLAVEGSYGVVALAPLGAAYAPWAYMVGVYSAALGNLVALLAGVRGVLLVGPSAVLVVLVPPLLATLLADPRLRLADGQPHVTLLVALVGVGVVGAGVAHVVIASLRWGGIARFVPYPVHAGFMNGVAVLMVLAMLPYAVGALGGGVGPAWATSANWQPGTAIVAAVTLWLALRPPRWTRAVPSYLVAVGAGTLLHHLQHAAGAPLGLGPLLGRMEVTWPEVATLAPLASPALLDVVRDHVVDLLQFSFALALTAGIQSTMAASVVDGVLGRRRDVNRLLRANGVATMAMGAFGLMPTAASASRSLVCVYAGGRGTWASLGFSLWLIVAVTVGAPLLQHVPMSAIAGVLFAVAWGLVDDWSRRASLTLARQVARGVRPTGSMATAYGVMALVAGTAVFVSINVGVAVGVVASILMFIRGNLRPPVRAVVTARALGSRKVRPPEAMAVLRTHGNRIAVVELDGALFFGTADAAAREIERVAADADQIVLDFRRVGDVDASGARVLLQAAARLRGAGKRLLLASLVAGDTRLAAIRDMDAAGVLAGGDVFPDVDRAVEQAEDHLLAGHATPASAAAPLALKDTLLGQALDDDEIALLAARLDEVHVARGGYVFRQGDPGDALYVVVAGQVGVWLPETGGQPARRLVSFTPGVVLGEIGLLRRAPRSADALAEDDAVLLRLSREAYDELAAVQPRLHARLLLALSLHLGQRLATLTDDVRASGGLR